MEVFLNLCWLSLLMPAYLLWRQRVAEAPAGRESANLTVSPLIFLCVLGCAFVLLFPVISATDDLHAMRPEMEESERACRDANRGASAAHALLHSTQPVLPSSVARPPDFEQIGTVLPFLPQPLGSVSALVPAGRGPPSTAPTAL
ncbi:MAG: hypothetical protein ABSD75_17495 [Terriglobales bacterium]|jgi:hypothetical protein